MVASHQLRLILILVVLDQNNLFLFLSSVVSFYSIQLINRLLSLSSMILERFPATYQSLLVENKAVSVMRVSYRNIRRCDIFIRPIISSFFDGPMNRLMATHHPVAILLGLTDLVTDYRHLIIFLMMIRNILLL